MAPSLSLQGLIVVICSLAVLSLVQALDTLYVKPTPDMPCNEHPCLTLMEYADNSSQYFSRETEAVFLPGQHLLGITILIKNTTTFIMRKETNSSQLQPEIVCTAAVGFAFFSVSFVSITDLAFISCGGIISIAPTYTTSVLSSYSVGLFVMANVTVKMSQASAVLIFNTTFHSLWNHFQDNTAGIEGGGIVAESSNVSIESCQFYNNSATGYAGGAVAIYSSVAVFSGVNIFAENKAQFGGGIFLFESAVSFEGSSTFQYNSANKNRGTIASEDSAVKFNGNTTFINNTENEGGGIFLGNSVVSFEGSNTFLHNSANGDGGAIASYNSVVKFNGNMGFINNYAISGILCFLNSALVSFIGNTTFIENGPSSDTLFFFNCSVVIEGMFTFECNWGGFTAETSNIKLLGISSFTNNTVTVSQGGNITFIENGPLLLFYNCIVLIEGTFNFKCNQGGFVAIFTDITMSGITNFVNNSRTDSAFTVLVSRIMFLGTMLFAGNCSHATGYELGALYIEASIVQFIGHTIFTDNAAFYGAAILATLSSVDFNGIQTFEHNFASEWGGAIYTFNSMVNITGCSKFISNTAGEQGGAISNTNSQLYISGNASFIGNMARFGGGVHFEYTSRLFLISPLELSFKQNSAEKGGAIFTNDATNTIFCFRGEIFNVPTSIESCFIHADSSDDVHLDFNGNIASNGGNNVFGGMLDRCFLNENLLSPKPGLSLLLNTTNISTISSEPLHLCFCMNNHINCTYDPPPFSIVRGATISVSAIALDQVNHTVAATIRSYFPYNNGTVSDFSLGQGVQQIGNTCTLLNYTVLTTAPNVTIFIYPEGPCRDIGNSQRWILIHLLSCPIAFELFNAQCICEMRLQPFTNSCSIESQTFTRNTNFWVGTEYRDGNYTGLILHLHCPLDYCISDYPADISVYNMDSQCNFNRTGILCGSCQQNLSLVLGSSQCLPCSNYYLALLMPFAVAGIALVVILFILRLTVSTGTLSGLIFYANVVAVNKEILFLPRTTNVLNVFIAWLNLDFGIETCFFNGMNIFSRTWLQYVFPFYIWLIVCIIIVTSHYSVRVPKLLGRNPTAVLATLFLLSYAKLLRTIIASLSATVLDYPGNSTVTVWLYNGSIQFLKGKHISLFLFSLLILLFLFIPYTMLLLLSQWLQTFSNKRPLFWMNSLRIKTFLDAYHAPYNIKHRYWTGLLLLLRCVLFLVFASNTSGDPSVNLLAITSVALCLTVSTRLTGQVYSKWWLDILEGSFILNLGITAVATYHVILSGGNQSAVAYLSVSVAFTEFSGIIIYHAYLQLKDTSMWNSALEWTQVLFQYWKSEENEGPPTPPEEEVIPKPPSTTFIELREPLLEFPG